MTRGHGWLHVHGRDIVAVVLIIASIGGLYVGILDAELVELLFIGIAAGYGLLARRGELHARRHGEGRDEG